MDGVRDFRDSFLEAAALGLLATATLFVSPLQIANRLDRWLFDVWSQLAPPAAPAGIVLVRSDDPGALSGIVSLARAAQARLVVATQPYAPGGQDGAFVLGPTKVPRDEARRQKTDWREGGHLLFEPDIDGVVRTDRSFDEDGTLTPSLAQRAASEVVHRAPEEFPAARTPASSYAPRWLRFYAPTFTEIDARAARADPTRLRGQVVVVGGSERAQLTPLGALPTHVLVAHALAGYLQNISVAADWRGGALAWGAAALLIALLGLPAMRSRALASVAPIVATLAVLALGTIAFRAGLWLPVIGPIAWLAIVGGLLAVRAPRTAARRPDQDLVDARRAAASGELVEAWSKYRQISPTSALLPELYELACGLDASGEDGCAADLFHRIAQFDGRFRDVAHRLVRSTQPRAPALDREAMPRTMGRYELLEPIGRGAMGFVYLGRDPKINRIVALKAIDLKAEVEPSELDEARQSFLREAEIAGQLSHPNIVTIFDVGETEGIAYLAMEYLKGHHLSDFAVRDRLLPVPVVLELLSRTADALDYAHAQNIVHRDIKPANIMYDSLSDGLKITDFGIARLMDVGRTRTGIVLGTPAFMSPEQLEGKNVNGHTDLFALGVSLYQLLTGQLPFRGASMTKLMFVIANEPHQSVTAVRDDLPEHLNAIVDRALAKDPADRFQSGAEMATAMRGVARAA
ncbi:MAG TPA: protein kinase [Gammaproteobacteria bacterium]|nr:protein kinase [Gammaproteobacteria bacterium]